MQDPDFAATVFSLTFLPTQLKNVDFALCRIQQHYKSLI